MSPSLTESERQIESLGMFNWATSDEWIRISRRLSFWDDLIPQGFPLERAASMLTNRDEWPHWSPATSCWSGTSAWRREEKGTLEVGHPGRMKLRVTSSSVSGLDKPSTDCWEGVHILGVWRLEAKLFCSSRPSPPMHESLAALCRATGESTCPVSSDWASRCATLSWRDRVYLTRNAWMDDPKRWRIYLLKAEPVSPTNRIAGNTLYWNSDRISWWTQTKSTLTYLCSLGCNSGTAASRCTSGMSASTIASDYQKLVLFVFVIDTFDRTIFSVFLLVIPYSCAGMILSRHLH